MTSAMGPGESLYRRRVATIIWAVSFKFESVSLEDLLGVSPLAVILISPNHISANAAMADS